MTPEDIREQLKQPPEYSRGAEISYLLVSYQAACAFFALAMPR